MTVYRVLTDKDYWVSRDSLAYLNGFIESMIEHDTFPEYAREYVLSHIDTAKTALKRGYLLNISDLTSDGQACLMAHIQEKEVKKNDEV